jgi:GTP-binding protein Era
VKSGFVPVVGRPNVGKSTLINALVGSKVSITSPRPQTTRNVIRGVVHRPDLQIVLVDTPGVHRPRTALGERLNERVTGSLEEADAAVFVIDATAPIGPGDRLIAGRLREALTPTVCVVNKRDAADDGQITEQLAEAGDWDFAAYVPISALHGTHLDPVVDEVAALLPEGPAFFPTDMTSDQTEAFLVGEIVREKFLSRLRDELPHSVAVMVDEMETGADDITRIHARILVERDSQKGIVIGKGGSVLKTAGSEARLELETILGTKVFLDLRVKVEKDWQQRPGVIDRLGL